MDRNRHYLTEYETMDDVMKSIPAFIEEMYNKKRRHSSLGYLSPAEYEKLAAKNLLEKRGIPGFIQVGPKLSNRGAQSRSHSAD